MRPPEIPAHLANNWKRYLLLFILGYTFNSFVDRIDPNLHDSDRPCVTQSLIESSLTQKSELADLKEELLESFMPILLVNNPNYYTKDNFGVVAQAIPPHEQASCPHLKKSGLNEHDWILTYAFVYKVDSGIPALKVNLMEQISITLPDEAISLAEKIDPDVRNAHSGDIEHVRLVVHIDPTTKEASIKFVEVKVHNNGFIRYSPQKATCTNNRVEIVVGVGKQANHISQQACDLSYGYAPLPTIFGHEPITFSGDICSVNGRVDPLELYDANHNIANGEPFEESDHLAAFVGNSVTSSVFENDRAPEFQFCDADVMR